MSSFIFSGWFDEDEMRADDAVRTAATDFGAAVEALVSDGATPTQAHVAALASAWVRLRAAIAAAGAKTYTESASCVSFSRRILN